MAADPKSQIEAAVRKALEKVAPAHANVPFVFERPKQASHGDFSLNIALQLAKPLNTRPRDLAQSLSDTTVAITPSILELIEKPEVAGPGFLNFRLKAGTKVNVIRQVLAEGKNFGRASEGRGKKVQVEFVSANPTGPLHVGHGRQAALGDAIAALLEWQGCDVTREFYYNDAGQQIQNLAVSVRARAREIQGDSGDFPEDGYRGEYIRELAERYLHDVGAELSDVE